MMKASHFILTAGMLVAASAYVAAVPAYAAHEGEHESSRAESHEHERHDQEHHDRDLRHHRESSDDRDDHEMVPGVPHPVTLSNGSAIPLEVEIRFLGHDRRDFRQTNNCGERLAGQGSCVINVTFGPRTPGKKSATMEIHTSGGTKYVYLSGTGI